VLWFHFRCFKCLQLQQWQCDTGISDPTSIPSSLGTETGGLHIMTLAKGTQGYNNDSNKTVGFDQQPRPLLIARCYLCCAMHPNGRYNTTAHHISVTLIRFRPLSALTALDVGSLWPCGPLRSPRCSLRSSWCLSRSPAVPSGPRGVSVPSGPFGVPPYSHSPACPVGSSPASTTVPVLAAPCGPYV
jgi:hypothetical protein